MLSRRLEKHATARSDVVALLAALLGAPHPATARLQPVPVRAAGRIVRNHRQS